MKLLEASLKAGAPADAPVATEVPSLAQICEAVVVRNLARYTDLSPLSVTDLVNIILKARIERDPALVLSFEQTQPVRGGAADACIARRKSEQQLMLEWCVRCASLLQGLAEDEVLDEQYWKPVVGAVCVASCRGLSPGAHRTMQSACILRGRSWLRSRRPRRAWRRWCRICRRTTRADC